MGLSSGLVESLFSQVVLSSGLVGSFSGSIVVVQKDNGVSTG